MSLAHTRRLCNTYFLPSAFFPKIDSKKMRSEISFFTSLALFFSTFFISIPSLAATIPASFVYGIFGEFVLTVNEVCVKHAQNWNNTIPGTTCSSVNNESYILTVPPNIPGVYPGPYSFAAAKYYYCPNTDDPPSEPSRTTCNVSISNPSEDRNVGLDNACVGNPINPSIGNKFQLEVDYVGTGAFPLRFERIYNNKISPYYNVRASQINLIATPQSPGSPTSRKYIGLPFDQVINPISINWRTSYDRTVRFLSAPDQSGAALSRPDGKVYFYSLTNQGTWITDSDIVGNLTRLSDTSGNEIGWRYRNAYDESETYDVSGKLLSIVNQTGFVQNLSYDALNRLETVSDTFNRSLSFTYDAKNRISTMMDPAGSIYTYTYDSVGNLSSIVFPDGKTRTYLYSESAYTSSANFPNALTGIIDENNHRFATYKYDSQGRAISTEHAGGAEKVTLAYNPDGTTTVTDALGTIRTYSFQTINGVVKNTGVTQPCATCGGSAAQNLTYDTNGNIVTKTDFNGIATAYVYDLTRNLETSRTEASGTPQARTITTQWHSNFRLPTLISEPGKTTTLTYDSRGLLTQKTLTDTALGTSRIWSYTYNSVGLLMTANGPRTDVNDITIYSYDNQGNVVSITNALNQMAQIPSYDAHGHPLTIIDPNGLVTTLTYSPRGWLTSRSVDGETTAYAYDGVGQLIKITLPDGSYLSYVYDAAHRLTSITDRLGNRISYTLDAMGNRTLEDIIDPNNVLTQTRSRVFSALNRLAQDIGAQNQTTNYSYDNNGNLTSVSDPLLHTTNNTYDALNRLVQVTDPNLGVTQYGYDANDRLTQVIDPRTLQTNYTYDGLDNLVQVASPDTGTTTNTYDAAGNLKTSTDARGAVTTYTYDALNRVTQIAAVLGASTKTTVFQYDNGSHAVGKLTSISDGAALTSYAYNNQGRLSIKAQQMGAITLMTSYTYEGTGRVSEIIYPSGKVIPTVMTTKAASPPSAPADNLCSTTCNIRPSAPPPPGTGAMAAATAAPLTATAASPRTP